MEQSLPDSTDRVLVLYDSGGPYGHVGIEYAIMLVNLLGHFDLNVSSKPVVQYNQGEMETRQATFYIGSTFDEKSYYDTASEEWQRYHNFLADAADTDATLIWINYNLHRLQEMMDGGQDRSFSDKYGFTNIGIADNLYNRVIYKEVELYKGVVPFANPGAALNGCIEEEDNMYDCSTELNTIEILDPSLAVIYALADSTLMAGAESPYITRSGNFWFVGDLPFSYISEEDRYLVFVDILHDMLQMHHDEVHQALVRLEDVSVQTSIADLTAVSDYLIRNLIPFAVAVIPQYREGMMNGTDLWLSETGRYLLELYLEGRASIIAHGYTHQRDAMNNPYNGISSDDFEFYRVSMNDDNSLNFEGPIEPDTQAGARLRMQAAISNLNQAGLQPFSWEAPHYVASENSYLGILSLFPIHYGRMVYFNYADDTTRMAYQFFPNIISHDFYGYRIIPENLGNIVLNPFEGYRTLLSEDLIRVAEKAWVVRDGFASFFYHPYLGVEQLRQVVEGLRGLGYTFASADELGS